MCVERIERDELPESHITLRQFSPEPQLCQLQSRMCWPQRTEGTTCREAFSLVSVVGLIMRISDIWHILDTQKIFIRTSRSLAWKN